MRLGNAAAARVRLIVWCKAYGRQVEPDTAQMAERYGADTPVLDWRERPRLDGAAYLLSRPHVEGGISLALP